VITVSDLAFGYSEKPLYEKVNFIVGKGQKVGIVGPNGSGKSTLLTIIRGEEDGYKGNIKVQGKIALVPQEIKYDKDMEKAATVREYVDPENLFLDHEIKKMFVGLELSLGLDHNPKTLSGGQKTKLALARALLSKPNILLLDEPTNFMDVAGKKWVMDFLSMYEGTVIVISHDLELMDKHLNKILAISPFNSSIKEYTGTYSTYLKLKKDYEEKLRKERVIGERHIERLKDHYKKMSKFDAKKSILRRKIEREKNALPVVPQELKTIKVSLPELKRIGEIPIRAIDITKSYRDKNVLTDLNFTILRNERIALIGPNGAGKSTFIKILMGMVQPDAGQVVKDDNLLVGYYSQEFETFDFTQSVIKTFCDKTQKPEDFARKFLGRFLLSNNKVYQKVATLSGGEKTRLAIAILTAGENNLLILDEPTTYLDVMSQRIILETLKEYKGTMILVSHTPEFVKELKPTKAFLFPEQKMVFWEDELLGKVEEV
jgi:ATP-binding cassette subfamily F protein 3